MHMIAQADNLRVSGVRWIASFWHATGSTRLKQMVWRETHCPAGLQCIPTRNDNPKRLRAARKGRRLPDRLTAAAAPFSGRQLRESPDMGFRTRCPAVSTCCLTQTSVRYRQLHQSTGSHTLPRCRVQRHSKNCTNGSSGTDGGSNTCAGGCTSLCAQQQAEPRTADCLMVSKTKNGNTPRSRARNLGRCK